jgi:hypothetical protein
MSKTAEGFEPTGLNRVAFLPFVRVLPLEEEGSSSRAVCPRDHAVYDACPVGEAAEAELSAVVAEALLQSMPGGWVSQAEINAARTRVKERDPSLPLDGTLQLALGREIKADAVLFGFIYCYRDRSGKAWASAVPAALGFCLHLVDPASGRELWSFSYAEEQQALSENLLEAPAFFKRKGQWITVAQMAKEAAAVVARALPWNAPAEKKKGPGKKKP